MRSRGLLAQAGGARGVTTRHPRLFHHPLIVGLPLRGIQWLGVCGSSSTASKSQQNPFHCGG